MSADKNWYHAWPLLCLAALSAAGLVFALIDGNALATASAGVSVFACLVAAYWQRSAGFWNGMYDQASRRRLSDYREGAS